MGNTDVKAFGTDGLESTAVGFEFKAKLSHVWHYEWKCQEGPILKHRPKIRLVRANKTHEKKSWIFIVCYKLCNEPICFIQRSI
jgi:hypothetical protein